ncbi:hypothetical protein [Amycolatopsis aidingensis]|uniref:hypothetical protein n=1 Tax=Amycolatopsis aidingensis TaxID=2842453 RepID=UPI001C0AF821|nr:hypothetical protein [Amycolatopsis aidingensis]
MRPRRFRSRRSGPAAAGPVFVDPRGRRRILVRAVSAGLALGLLGLTAVLAISVLGPAPGLPAR